MAINETHRTILIHLLFIFINTCLGLAGVVGGVFSNLANAANAILSSPSKLGTFFIKKSFSKLYTLLVRTSIFR